MSERIAIHVNPELSAVVQMLAFRAGYLWHGETERGQDIRHTDYPILRFRDGNYIGGNYTVDGWPELYASTQMDQVRAFFGVAEPAPAQTVAPNWDKIVVVFRHTPNLVADIRDHCVRNGFDWNIPDNVHGVVATIGIIRSETARTLGFNDSNTTIEWWNNEHFTGPGFHILDAATQMDQVIAWLERNSPNKPEIKQMDKETPPPADEPGKKKQPPTKFVIRIDHQDHGAAIQELAIAAGYFTNPGARSSRLLHGQFRQYLSLGAYVTYGEETDRRLIVQDARRSTFDGNAKDFRSMDQMEQIKAALNAVRDWALESAKTRPASEFVNPNLLALIKGTPKAEMVRGFIRKEFKLKLPEAVQNEGADAILKYLSENVKYVTEWPKLEPPKDDSVEIEFEVSETMIESRTRNDSVKLRVKVPGRVVRSAKDEGDPYVITRWIEDNTSWVDLPEINRVVGEAEPDGDGFHHSSYNDYTDEDALASRISEQLGI